MGAVVWLHVTWWLSDPTSSEDLWRYLWDGRLWWLGAPTYLEAPSSELLTPFVSVDEGLQQLRPLIGHADIPTIYPPGAQWLFRLVTIEGVSLTLWRALVLLAQLLSVEALWRLTSAPPTSAPPTSAPPTSAPPTSAPVTSAPSTSAPPTSAPSLAQGAPLLFGLCPVWVFDCAQGAHLDAAAICLALWGLVAAQRQHFIRAGALLGLGVSVKVLPGLWLSQLTLAQLRSRAQRSVKRAVALSCGALLSASLVSLPFWSELSSGAGWRGAQAYGGGWRFNESLFWLFLAVGELSKSAGVMLSSRGVAQGLILALLLGLVWRTASPQRADSATLSLSLITFTLLLCSPVVFSWYLGWLFALTPLLWAHVFHQAQEGRSQRAHLTLLTSALIWGALAPLTYLPRLLFLEGLGWRVDLWWRALEYLLLGLILVIGTRYTHPQTTSART